MIACLLDRCGSSVYVQKNRSSSLGTLGGAWELKTCLASSLLVGLRDRAVSVVVEATDVDIVPCMDQCLKGRRMVHAQVVIQEVVAWLNVV